MSSSSEPCATNLPRLITRTSSTVCAISASTWLETSTVRPLGGLRAQEVAQPADPLRIEAVRGLVQYEAARIAEQGAREAEALPHAQRVRLHALVAGALELHQAQHLLHAASGTSRSRGDHPQVVAPAPAGMELWSFEHGANGADGVLQLAVGAPLDRCGARGGQCEAEERAERGGLAGAVRAQEAEHTAGGGFEAETIDRDVCSKALRQVVDLKHLTAP